MLFLATDKINKFNISINQGKDDIKNLIRTELVPLLRQRLSKFTQDLISSKASIYSTVLFI